MQYQMSTAPVPAPKPSAPAVAPEIVKEAPKPPRSKGPWIFLLLVILGGAVAWWLTRGPEAQSRPAAAAAIRTATVSSGAVAKTLRLTGTTGAERYSSLMTPQLRGSRAESLREGRTFSSPGANYPVQSNASRTGGGGSNLSMSGGGAGGAAGSEGQVSSTAGASSGGGSAAMRSATSRVSRGGGSSGGGSQVSAGSSGGGNNSNNSLGSTAGALVGSGGGGGGMGGGGSAPSGGGGGGGRRGGMGGGGDEFSLVLQAAAPGGTYVKKGAVVAEFDRQYMMNRLEDYRAAFAQMEASFRKLVAEVDVQKKAHQQSIDNAKSALEKARLDLKTIPVLGVIESERLRLSAEEAEARYKQLLAEVKFVDIKYNSQIKTADFELKQAKIELQRAEANADRMILRAPIDGLVVMQTTFRGSEYAQIQPGDQLWPGMRFMQIVDTSSMVINASVNQVDADSIRVGAKANVRFDAFPGLELPATVFALGAMPKQGGVRAQYVKEIPVVLKLDKIDPRVIPDLSVSVDVELASEAQVAAVAPLSAIFREGSEGKPFVYVKQGNDRWERRPVELGLIGNLTAAVRTGLKRGEVVALEPPPSTTESSGDSARKT